LCAVDRIFGDTTLGCWFGGFWIAHGPERTAPNPSGEQTSRSLDLPQKSGEQVLIRQPASRMRPGMRQQDHVVPLPWARRATMPSEMAALTNTEHPAKSLDGEVLRPPARFGSERKLISGYLGYLFISDGLAPAEPGATA
jgi:hypothetical protein